MYLSCKNIVRILLFLLAFNTSLVLAATPTNNFSTIDDLIDFLKAKQIRQIEQLIPLLPTSTLRKVTFVHTPRSTTQSGDRLNPRMIFYTDGGRLLFTINGSPEYSGYNQIEVIEYNPKDHSYAFHTVDFSQNKPKVKKNETSCQRCHQGKPIWDSYPLWPGVFGAFTFHQQNVDAARAIEEKWWQDFLANAKDHPRYKAIYEYSQKSSAQDLGLRNTQFSDVLGRQNIARVTSKIKQHPLFARIENSLYEATIRRDRNSTIQTLASQIHHTPVDQELLESVITKARIQLSEYLLGRAKRLENIFGVSVKPGGSHVQAFDFVFEGYFDNLVLTQYVLDYYQTGIQLSHEGLALEKGAYSVMTPYSSIFETLRNKCLAKLKSRR